MVKGEVVNRQVTFDAEMLFRILANGVHTSSELIGLMERDGHSNDSARQFLSRHANKNRIWRSQRLRLPRDERLFADRESVGSVPFFSQVGEKLRASNRQGIARAVAALGVHRLLHRVDLLRLLAVAPTGDVLGGKSDRRLTYEAELESLEELGARVIKRGTSLESVVVPAAIETDVNYDLRSYEAIERIRVELLLTRLLTDRFRRQNLISWNRIDIPDSDKPYVVFNGQVFSAFGFSYMGPLKYWKKDAKNPTPCPVVIDCYHGLCLTSQVEAFLQRIERSANRGRRRQPIVGAIAARDFDKEAWEAARRANLLTISFRQIFGDEALNSMVEYERLIGGFGRFEAEASQEQFKQFTTRLQELKTNPVIADLRAIGLEALCALILQNNGFESPELGRIVPWNETTRDVDVFAIRGDKELRVVECKAYHRHKSVRDSDVKKFFSETVPALKKWLSQNNRHFTECVAEIWTTGPKGKNAENTLKELKPPKSDRWTIRRMKDMHDEIPRRIRERSIKLLQSIALTDDESPVD